MDPSHYFSPQQTKRRAEKRLQYRCFPVNFRKFLRTHFLRTLQLGCLWRWIRRNQTTPHDIPIEQLFFLSDSSWIILAIHFSLAGQKLKWGKNKWIISFLRSFKKGSFSLKKTFLAELYSTVISSLHSSYRIYTKGG